MLTNSIIVTKIRKIKKTWNLTNFFRSFLPDTFTRVLIAKYVTILQYIDSYFQNEGGVFLSPYLKKNSN